MRAFIIALLWLSAHAMAARAADNSEAQPADTLAYRVEAQGSATTGDNTPLWLNANKYGLSSLATGNGYIRAAAWRPMHTPHGQRKWDYGYCVDLAVATGYTSTAIVQQLYAEAQWLKGTLTVGSKEWPMELKNNRLSSGAQTLGINARPVPQVRIALPDYCDVPLTHGWLALKGHVAFGMTTDDNWQKSFTQSRSKYTEHTLYHSKAGYLRIGKGDGASPVTLELGLEMAAQFGGKSYNVSAEGGDYSEVDNGSGIKAFWNAFWPGGADAIEGTYKNIAGNQLGSWLFRLNIDQKRWCLALYGDHFFEDHSAMFLLDYDGYGHGAEWNERKDNRYLLYSLKDMMLGAELKLKGNAWIDDIVVEYLYTKYQSGPIYHDHNHNISDHIGGMDNYYNHSIFTGWQHWGQVMGNPLYLSPIYNTDGQIKVENNRFYAFHIGLGGAPTPCLSYRVLASWQKGFGSYDIPYTDPKESLSVMAEATYSFSQQARMAGWSVRAACGIDCGAIRGNNRGLQLTIAHQGVLKQKKK